MSLGLTGYVLIFLKYDAHSFPADLTGAKRARSRKITRENMKATMKAARVKQKPAHRYVDACG